MSLVENLKHPIIDCLKKIEFAPFVWKFSMERFKELIHGELIPHSLQWFNMEPFICGNIFLRLCHTFLLNNQTIIQICKNQGTKQWDIYKAIRRYTVMRLRYKLTGLVYKVMKSRYKVVKPIV